MHVQHEHFLHHNSDRRISSRLAFRLGETPQAILRGCLNDFPIVGEVQETYRGCPTRGYDVGDHTAKESNGINDDWHEATVCCTGVN